MDNSRAGFMPYPPFTREAHQYERRLSQVCRGRKWSDDMSKKSDSQFEERIDLITEALKKAISDVQFIRENENSEIRCHMLVATLRSAIRQAVAITNKGETVAEKN
jgi:hypothetical protein